MSKTIKSFTDLESWKASHKLATQIYKQVDKFPQQDTFGLASQMQRAALSISSNIAEGFGRQSTKDKQRFYIIARGSIVELQNQLLLARDTGRISDETFSKLAQQSTKVHKLIHGLIRSSNKVKKNTSS